jgi:hypothetical protein
MSNLSSRVRTARKTTTLTSTQRRRKATLNAWARKRRTARTYAYRDKLPFTDRKAQGPGYWWSVNPTGDYQADYEVGRQYAMDFWRQCGAHGNFGLELGEIMFAMHRLERKRSGARRDRLSGIEVGFIRTIGEIVVCLVGTPALISSLSKDCTKLNIQKRTFKNKLRKTVEFVDLLVENWREHNRKHSAKILLAVPRANVEGNERAL